MQALGSFIRKTPRSTAATAFGISTATLIHFAWYADARMSGGVPALTLGAGVAHALAGALTGPRLLDGTRTRTSSQAALLGAGTSLLALAFFAPAFAIYLSASNTQPSVLSYLAVTFFAGVFAFLAAGWALLLLSVGVAWGLYRLTRTSRASG